MRTSVLTALLLGGSVLCVSAQESDQSGLFGRLFGGSNRVAAPQDQSFGAQQQGRPPVPAPGAAVAQGPGMDAGSRFDRLEAQIRQLTGLVEQLQYRNQQLESQVRRMQEDTEYRFQELHGGGGSGGSPAARPSAPPPLPPPVVQPQQPAAVPPRRGDAFDPSQQPSVGAPRRGDAFDPSQYPNAPGAPRPLGTTPPSAPLSQTRESDGPVGAPGGRNAGAPLDLSTVAAPNDPSYAPGMSAPGGGEPQRGGNQVATLPPTNSPKDNYDLAYGYILRRDYPLAEEGFRTFLRKYPNDRMAPDAEYWLGEAMFQRQRYRDAAETFLNVSTKYETTAKAPDALLRLGQSLAALGEREAACAAFGEVSRKYPRASVSVRQGVEREQKRVHC